MAFGSLRPFGSLLAFGSLRPFGSRLARLALLALRALRPDWAQVSARALWANRALDALRSLRPDGSQVSARALGTSLALYALLPARPQVALRSWQPARALRPRRALGPSLAALALGALRPSDSRRSLRALRPSLASRSLGALGPSLAGVSLGSASPAPRLYLGALDVKRTRSPPSAGPLARAQIGVALPHRDLSLAGGPARSAPTCAAAARGGGFQRLEEGGVRAVNRVILVYGRPSSQALLLDVFQQVRERRHLLVTRLVIDEDLVCFLADLLQDARGPRHLLASYEELADVSVFQPLRAP
jgi:hypothetical protein